MSSARPAGLARRLAAITYDALIQLALFFTGTALLLPFTGGQALTPGNPCYGAYLLGISLLYNGWSWKHGGQTIGMRAWRIRIIAPGGAPVSWKRIIPRYFTALAGAAALGLGFLWMYTDTARRTWQDRLSGTLTVWDPP